MTTTTRTIPDVDTIHATLDTDEPDIRIVADAIGSGLAFRDAVVSLVIDPTITIEEFRLLAEHPHDPRTRALAYRVVRTAIEHPETLDMARITRIARAIGGEAGRRDDPQAHAAAAYLWWMVGDDPAAAGHALTALALDEDTSLAALVMAAIQRRTRDNMRRI